MADWVQVEGSSRIKRFRYDESTQKMEVEFVKSPGDIYTLHNVDARHAAGLKGAGSAGRYYQTYLHGHTTTRGARPR